MNSTLQDRRPADETARLGEEIYARLTKSAFGPSDQFKYAAIAVESGNYEIDANDRAAIDRMKAREPGAHIWLVRIGLPAAAYFRSPR